MFCIQENDLVDLKLTYRYIRITYTFSLNLQIHTKKGTKIILLTGQKNV